MFGLFWPMIRRRGGLSRSAQSGNGWTESLAVLCITEFSESVAEHNADRELFEMLSRQLPLRKGVESRV